MVSNGVEIVTIIDRMVTNKHKCNRFDVYMNICKMVDITGLKMACFALICEHLRAFVKYCK